jgi:hypothetical protein
MKDMTDYGAPINFMIILIYIFLLLACKRCRNALFLIHKTHQMQQACK